MKTFGWIAAIAVLVALLLWFFRSDAPEPAPEAAPRTAVVAPPTDVPSTPLAAEAASEPREVVRDVAAPPTPPAESIATPASASAAAPLGFDRKARDWIHVIVQDTHGAPVPNAEIRLTGLRSPRDPGSHWGWFLDEPSIGRTAIDGTAKLWFPVWIDADSQTGAVSLSVQHPDFITHDDQRFEIGPEPRVIVLEQGGFVVVSGWFESPSEVVKDVFPHMTWGARIQPDAWLPIKDGRLSCASVPPGEHGIYLTHNSPEHGVCFSAAEMFTLEVGEQKAVHLQLFPARKLEGQLDPAVPRPILNGAVTLNLQIGERTVPNATMLREYGAPVNADGTFVIENLPPGDGQIIAICDGWASAGVPAGREYLHQLDAKPELVAEQLAIYGNVPQPVPADFGATFAVKMEPTATLKATLVDAAGKPVEGATLTLWPNVVWRTGYSNLFMQRTCEGKSDANGLVTITNIPSGQTSGGVAHPTLVVPANAQGRRYIEARFEPGKTTDMRIELVESSDE